MARIPLTVVVLTKDEEMNLERTLPILAAWAEDIVLVDSYSTDGTVPFGERYGARILQNEYHHHSQQINWALTRLGERAQEWVLLLNADELPDAALRAQIERAVLERPPLQDAYSLSFRVHFLGKPIRHGGACPPVVRLFRRGMASCEDRLMDEKLIVRGRVGHLAGSVIDDNVKGLDYFITKHIAYSAREAKDYLLRKSAPPSEGVAARWFGQAAGRRRAMKQLYDKLPLFWRARLYYWYRLYFRLGFLDGREGRAFHFLQGYWYRYVVDLQISEALRRPPKA